MPPRLTPGPVFPLQNAVRNDLSSDGFASEFFQRACAMEIIEVVEGEKGWTVKHGARILFIDTVEERTFQTALAISNTLFDEGVRSQVVLVRKDN